MAETVAIKKSTYNRMLVSVVVLAIAFSFVSGFVFGGMGVTGNVAADAQEQVAPSQPAPSQPSPQAPSAPERIQVSEDGDPFKGDANAPVTIIEFSDFECPFCGRFYTDTLPQLEQHYIDTGKAKLVYRDFPLSFHPNAAPASEASECANEQGAFWGFHDTVFENQRSLNRNNYIQWATDLGLNVEQFTDCVDSRKYQDEVQNDFTAGASAGVSGTPSFFVNGQRIVGAQPFSVFQQLIEAELAG